MSLPKLNEEFVYRDVVAGHLQIEPNGDIWRVSNRRGPGRGTKMRTFPCERHRAERLTTDGYLTVTARYDYKTYQAMAHRIVFRHAHGPIPDGLTINHKDGNKSNNVLDNLELATFSEQALHAIHVLGKKILRGEDSSSSKVTIEQVREIRRRRELGEELASIASDFGITYQNVWSIATRKNWRSVQ